MLLLLFLRGRSGLLVAPSRLTGGGASHVVGFAWCCRHGLGGPGVCAVVGVSSHTEVPRNIVAPLRWPSPPCSRPVLPLLWPFRPLCGVLFRLSVAPPLLLLAACRCCGTDGRRPAGLRWSEPGNSSPWPSSPVLGRAVSQLNSTQLN